MHALMCVQLSFSLPRCVSGVISVFGIIAVAVLQPKGARLCVHCFEEVIQATPMRRLAADSLCHSNCPLGGHGCYLKLNAFDDFSRQALLRMERARGEGVYPSYSAQPVDTESQFL